MGEKEKWLTNASSPTAYPSAALQGKPRLKRGVMRKGIIGMYQLRIYEVNPEKRVAFHDRFQNDAMRIMEKYGFNIVAIWESVTVSKLEFVYILQWPDAETMERQWKAFLSDQEWINIKKKMDQEIGEPVLQATGRVLDPVGYSPTLTIQVP